MANLNSKHHGSTAEKLEHEQLKQMIEDLPRGEMQPEDYLDSKATTVFNYIAENLGNDFIKTDNLMLNTFANEYAKYATATIALKKHGLVDADGKTSPYLKIQTQALSQLTKLANELTITPKSRIAAGLKKVKSGAVDDPFAEVLNRD